MSGTLCSSCQKYKAKEGGICGYCARKKESLSSDKKIKSDKPSSPTNGRPSHKKKAGPSVESYYHKSAKAILASWLLDQGYEVAVEFPICNPNKHDAAAKPWHLAKEFSYPLTPDASLSPFSCFSHLKSQPSREWCAQQEMPAAVIYDLVAFKEGRIKAAYEIYYKHKCDARKIAIIRSNREKSSVKYKVHEVSARWILGQIKKPKTIKVMRTF